MSPVLTTDFRDLTDEEARRASVLKWGAVPDDVLPAWVAEMDYALMPEIVEALCQALPGAQGYSDSRGILPAREAVARHYTELGIANVGPEDVLIGNGVSELISLVLQALVSPGDEILVPSPDYPLWTAQVTLQGGRAVHYPCDEQNGWMPDLAAIEDLVT